MTNLNQATQYGIEIEGISQMRMSELAEYLTANTGIEVEHQSYNHRVCSHWKLVSDSSIEIWDEDEDLGYRYTFELVSPILKGEQGLEQAYKLLNKLQEMTTVNSTCGLHVHFGAASWDLARFKNFAKAWIRNQDVLDRLQPIKRRDNNEGFCQNLRSASDSQIDACPDLNSLSELLTHNDRYYKVNFSAFWRHQTVEIRHHAGSVNPETVTNWVRLLDGIIQNSEKLASSDNFLPFQDRLQALCNSSGVESIPSTLKGLKSAVMGRLGLSDSKAVKKWAVGHGLTVDLRSKAGWAKVLQAAALDAPSDSYGLYSFYKARAEHYDRYNMVLI